MGLTALHPLTIFSCYSFELTDIWTPSAIVSLIIITCFQDY